MTPSLSGRIALVTGATRGIGLEVVRQLASSGMTVVMTGRDLAKTQAAAQPLLAQFPQIIVRALDVSADTSARALADSLTTEYGRLDVLVNNAAAFADWTETASTADLEAAALLLQTNLFGPWRVTQALLPLLRRSQHPRIVQVSSGAGSHADPAFGLASGPGSASYGISKAALNALTTKFAVELAGTGILINAVCPGFTATAPGMEAMGARPVAEGAAGVVWAATLPDDGPSGGFFRDGQPLGW